MRNAFIDELVIAAEANENIALVVGDLGYGVIEPFAKRFPNRFFNSGVAEQNMMGFSAGLASEGFHVFVYSIANFPTFRCAEQIRNDVDYHNLPVTVVVVGGGLAYGNLGYSHHAVQDLALMRIMPNMLIAAPGDPMETRACMRYLIAKPQPAYLRLGKAGEPCLHSAVPDVSPGKWLRLHRGTEMSTLLSTGATLPMARKWLETNRAFHGFSLHSMPLWSMQSKATQSESVTRWDQVITVEDHLIDGGFGSWLMESVASNPSLLSRIQMRGLDSLVCGMVGKQETLNAAGGLVENEPKHANKDFSS